MQPKICIVVCLQAPLHILPTLVKSNALASIKTQGSIQTVYVRNSVLNTEAQDLLLPTHAFQLRKGPSEVDGYKFIKASLFPLNSTPRRVLTSQRWPLALELHTFKISREPRQLAGVVLLERDDGERLAILLGSKEEFGVGFGVASISDITDYGQLQRSFSPQEAGTNMVLRHHQVRVSVDPQIHHGAKYYMVDIAVQAIYHDANPIDVITEIIPGLQRHERPPNAIKDFSRGLGKLKSLFRSPRDQGSSRLSED